MMHRLPQEPHPVGADSPNAEGAVALVRRLIECADSASREGGEVLLDLEVDGVRCRLIALQGHSEHAGLSPREQEIARMVAEGYPNKTIAVVLDISSWTVSTYVRRIFAKLGVRSRAAMVARLAEERMIEPGRSR